MPRARVDLVRILAPLLVAAVVVAVAPGCTKQEPAGPGVRALVDEYWAAYLERYPEIATYNGVTSAPHDRLTDNSLPAVARWQGREDVWLRRLRDGMASLDPGSHDATAAAAVREALEAAVATRVCQTQLWSLSDTFSGWQQNLADWAAAQPVGTPEARRMALARWHELPRFVDTEIVNLREGLRRGLTAPRSTVRQVIVQVDDLGAPSADSPLLEPARRDGDAVFGAALGKIVAEEVRPALVRYRDFLEREYSPAARETTGVGALPAGAARYAGSVRAHTTLDIPAPEIHHALGWSRAQAIEYMLAHTNSARDEIESEVDRYISWPGQAVGYMVGALEIQRLRSETERRLGPRFDIRRFHDQVLEDGTVPMSALRAKLERWNGE